MAGSPANDPERPPAMRVLCLGNDLLADDGLGFRVARALRDELGPDPVVDIVETPEFGFALLDHLQDVRRLVVVDSVVTGVAPPGTIYRIAEEEDWESAPGASPHYIGLFEALAAGRTLGLPVAEDVTILAVEAADVTTVGGAMSAVVEAAVPRVVSEVLALVGAGTAAGAGTASGERTAWKGSGRPARARSD